MANAKSLEKLAKWLDRDEWHDAFSVLMELHVGPACARAGVPLEQMAGVLGQHHANVVCACVFEDFLALDLQGGRNIVDDYLERRGWNESATNRRYMTALRTSVMSLYEVSDIVRDQSFLARDLVRGGEPVRISERMGTHYLKPWDRIGARIVQMGSRNEMAGGLLPFQRDASDKLLDALQGEARRLRRQAGKSARKDTSSGAERPAAAETVAETELLRSSAFLFTNIWLEDVLERLLHPVMPQLQNTDGDDLVFTTVDYPLADSAGVAAVVRVLDTVPVLHREGDDVWNWLGPRRPSAKNPPTNVTLITTLGDGSMVLGTITLKDRHLVLETNSRQRADRGRALIEPVLGWLAGPPRLEAKTADELMASRPAAPPVARRPSGLLPAEERAIIHANLDQHYTAVLSEPVTLLGNKTPRQAARSAKGREKVVEWLKYLENQAAHQPAGSPMAGYDLGWLWQALGVDDRRR